MKAVLLITSNRHYTKIYNQLFLLPQPFKQKSQSGTYNDYRKKIYSSPPIISFTETSGLEAALNKYVSCANSPQQKDNNAYKRFYFVGFSCPN